MKKIIFVMNLLFILILAGCAANSLNESPVAEAIDENINTTAIDLKDFDLLYTDYLRLPFTSTVISATWNNAQEINPDKFVDFFSYDQLFKNIEWEGEQGYPAEELEEFIKRYFDVSTDYIRTSSMYDSSNNIYISEGIGGAATARVVGAKQEGTELFLDFEVYNSADDETAIWGGTLTIQLLGEDYKYIACNHWGTNSSSK